MGAISTFWTIFLEISYESARANTNPFLPHGKHLDFTYPEQSIYNLGKSTLPFCKDSRHAGSPRVKTHFLLITSSKV